MQQNATAIHFSYRSSKDAIQTVWRGKGDAQFLAAIPVEFAMKFLIAASLILLLKQSCDRPKGFVAMAIIIGGFCQDCNSPVEFHVAQAISSGQLFWDFFYICYNCGCQIGGHDTGIPPEKIRKAILEAEGEWSLAVLETGKNATIATKILRAIMGLSLSEAMKLKKMIPGTVVTGTRAEIERLRIILAAEKLQAESYRR